MNDQDKNDLKHIVDRNGITDTVYTLITLIRDSGYSEKFSRVLQRAYKALRGE